MSSKNSKREFFVVLGFCAVVVLALTNGFVLRIYAQEQRVEIYREIEPIGDVIDIILREYVRDVDIKEVVEGALGGMMGSLDRNSAYVSAEELEALREETKGEFEGIGVSIKQDEEGKLMVFMPILGSPAAKAGILPYDLILAIDGKSTEDMDTSDAADLIRGRRGTFVTLTLLREPGPDGAEGAEAELVAQVIDAEHDVRFRRFMVNAMVTNGHEPGAPIIDEINPDTALDLVAVARR